MHVAAQASISMATSTRLIQPILNSSKLDGKETHFAQKSQTSTISDFRNCFSILIRTHLSLNELPRTSVLRNARFTSLQQHSTRLYHKRGLGTSSINCLSHFPTKRNGKEKRMMSYSLNHQLSVESSKCENDNFFPQIVAFYDSIV
jgi:hypothetical protein